MVETLAAGSPTLERTPGGPATKGVTLAAACWPRSRARSDARAHARCSEESYMPGPGRFTVVVADFLDETSIESPVLGEIADLVLCRAMRRGRAGRAPARGRRDHALPRHPPPRRGQLRPAPAVQVRGPGRRRLQQRRPRGGDPARGDRLQRARLRDRGSGRPRDHVPAGPGSPARTLPRGHPGGNVALPDRGRHAPAARQDPGPDRLRPDRHRDRRAGQGARARRGLLRPVPPPGDGQGAGHPPRLLRSRSCSSRATSSACTATSTSRPTISSTPRPSPGCGPARS